MKQFQYFLEGHTFHVATDYKSLTFIFKARSDLYTPRQSRHFDYISQFTTDLCGLDNSIADDLLWIEANALHMTQDLPPVIDFVVMAKAQQTDPELQTLLVNPLFK